jgi:Fe-S cluster assembly ATP-binding protein
MSDKIEIIDLHAGIAGKEILKGVSLTVNTGEIHAIMGPNGSGKSTLAYTLMGHPKYQLISGDIKINGESIIGLPPTQRALRGLFLGFQYPLEIPGVSLSNFLRISYNATRKNEPMLVRDFRKMLEDKFELVGMERSFATRYLNEGFSGYVKPQFVHVLVKGRVAVSGGPELAEKLEQEGYRWIAGAEEEEQNDNPAPMNVSA